ncbi:MAG: histidine phosphatase family protein [Clostridiales bacterium]|nr:histidine phosphatase family protein [Clostridiales bacterium]
MKIVLIRHAKVDYDWRKWSSARQFDADCEGYDRAPVLSGSYDVPEDDISRIYISSLQRTRDTARQIFGDKECISSELIDEVPLSSSIGLRNKMPLSFWNVTGRLQWWLNCRKQKEGRKQTFLRAALFVDMLVAKNEDCAVVTHGFFMHTLISVLKKQGFHIGGTSLHYGNGQCIVAEI